MLSTFVYRFLCRGMFLFLLGKFLEIDLLHCMANLCLTFDYSTLLNVVVPFYIPTSDV